MQLHIPQPCNEDWNSMVPTSGGRHCGQCAQTVVDFTGMSPEAIGFYLAMHSRTNICGRMTEVQLQQDIPTPEEYVLQVARSPWPLLKQIAALLLFVLFIGAPAADAQRPAPKKTEQNVTPTGKAGHHPDDQQVTTGRVAPPNRLITRDNRQIMGKMMVQPKAPGPVTPEIKPDAQVIQGGIRFVPDSTAPPKPTPSR